MIRKMIDIIRTIMIFTFIVFIICPFILVMIVRSEANDRKETKQQKENNKTKLREDRT